MIDIRSVFVSGTILTSLIGCGSAADTSIPPQPPIAARPDVVVTFDGEHHACLVALSSETQGSAISCGDVVSFIRNELRLPNGSIYDIRTVPDVDEAEMDKVEASLKDAGYRSIGGRHVMFITAPHKDH